MQLNEFDFECVHKPGARMQHVDAISRSPADNNDINQHKQVMHISDTNDDWLLTTQLQHKNICEIVNVIKEIRKSDHITQLKNEINDSLLYQKR